MKNTFISFPRKSLVSLTNQESFKIFFKTILKINSDQNYFQLDQIDPITLQIHAMSKYLSRIVITYLNLTRANFSICEPLCI